MDCNPLVGGLDGLKHRKKRLIDIYQICIEVRV